MQLAFIINLSVVITCFFLGYSQELKINKKSALLIFMGLLILIIIWSTLYIYFSDTTIINFITLQDLNKASITLSIAYGIFLSVLIKFFPLKSNDRN